jgi:hypothetical protein
LIINSAEQFRRKPVEWEAATAEQRPVPIEL